MWSLFRDIWRFVYLRFVYFRALEGMPGIKVGGYNMNNIRYADDTVLIADNENELQEMLDTVVRESERKKAYL